MILTKKFEKLSKEYQNYFIARDYKPRKVRKQFSDSRNISREEATQPKTHNEKFYTSCNLITQFNPLLPYIKTIIKKHLPVLHSNQDMLKIFPSNTINVTYKRGKNLRELISLSLFARVHNQHYSSSEKCCGKQYIGSAISFKERFIIHKSDINTGKVRCGVADHLLNVCHSEGSLNIYKFNL